MREGGRRSVLPVLPQSAPQTYVCAFSLGGIDELAYVSDSGCRFDGQEKSVVCTVSSDSTVRAWDVQEVSWVGGQGAAHGILVRSFPFTSRSTPVGSL